MAGRGGARQAFSEEDRARVLTLLAANGGNVKRTAREAGVSPATIRSWKGKSERGAGPSEEAQAAAVEEFVGTATRIRDKALVLLEAQVETGLIKPRELITVIGVLDDKLTRAQGLPEKPEDANALPPAEAVREAVGAAVTAAIAAAERRQAEIDDAGLVESEAEEIADAQLIQPQSSS